MAKRIAIVLSQSKRASPTHHELEGDVVAELLMVHGLEVNLIPHLTNLGADDTGLLCLEGITGDMVMLSWLECAEAHRSLATLGIHGRSGRTVFSNDSAVESGEAIDRAEIESLRTIYHIDLRLVDAAKGCCAEIERIRNEASVQVVDVGLANSAQPKQPAGSSDSALPGDKSSNLPAARPAATQPTQITSQAAARQADLADDDDESLDRLMEQFDAWDV